MPTFACRPLRIASRCRGGFRCSLGLFAGDERPQLSDQPLEVLIGDRVYRLGCGLVLIHRDRKKPFGDVEFHPWWMFAIVVFFVLLARGCSHQSANALEIVSPIKKENLETGSARGLLRIRV